jgi:hypothetical protein
MGKPNATKNEAFIWAENHISDEMKLMISFLANVVHLKSPFVTNNLIEKRGNCLRSKFANWSSIP